MRKAKQNENVNFGFYDGNNYTVFLDAEMCLFTREKIKLGKE